MLSAFSSCASSPYVLRAEDEERPGEQAEEHAQQDEGVEQAVAPGGLEVYVAAQVLGLLDGVLRLRGLLELRRFGLVGLLALPARGLRHILLVLLHVLLELLG